jgi:hypothetical protein
VKRIRISAKKNVLGLPNRQSWMLFREEFYGQILRPNLDLLSTYFDFALKESNINRVTQCKSLKQKLSIFVKGL